MHLNQSDRRDIKLADASLEDYVQARMASQRWGQDRLYVNEFFQGQPYVSTEKYINVYAHNIAQWVMTKFLEEVKGLKKGVACDVEDGSIMSPTMHDIETDLGQTFKAYKKGMICYEGKVGRKKVKVIVHIRREDEHDIFYRIYSSPEMSGLMEEWFAYARQHNLYRGKKIMADLTFLQLADVCWDDVIIPPATKKMLQNLVCTILKYQKVMEKNGLSLNRGVMLTGNPGNGKTCSLRVIAKEAPISVVYASPSMLERSVRVRQVCEMARDLAPCILMIEDIDFIAENRDDAYDSSRVMELMNQMDGIEDFGNVITLATTNAPDKIEDAIKNRPGRFDRIIEIKNPDKKSRKAMVKLFTKRFTLQDVDVDVVADMTKDLSGSHLQDLCHTAAEMAIIDGSLDQDEMVIICQRHFEEAHEQVKDKSYSTFSDVKEKSRPRTPIGFAALRGDDL